MELKILDMIQYIRNPILDSIMIFVSSLANRGEIWIFFGVLLFVIEFYKNKKVSKYRNVRNVVGRNGNIQTENDYVNHGVVILFSLLLSLLIVNIALKPIVARIRPYEINKTVELIIPVLNDFSFPSGHTSVSFAGAMAIFFHNKKLSIYAFVLASIIAFSRLYLYVHYPSDVFAGAIIGICCGVIAYYTNIAIYKFLRDI